jgi:hypothetical protein
MLLMDDDDNNKDDDEYVDDKTVTTFCSVSHITIYRHVARTFMKRNPCGCSLDASRLN